MEKKVTWIDLLNAMMEHSRGFTEEEAKAHQRVLDSIGEVEEENIFA